MTCDQQGLPEVGTVTARDQMDDGSPICLAVTIDRRDGSATFDFEGTGPEVGCCSAWLQQPASEHALCSIRWQSVCALLPRGAPRPASVAVPRKMFIFSN